MFGLKWLESKQDQWHAFESEALQYRGDLFRTAMWLTRNQTDAEDLVQETMFQAMRSYHLYETGTNCKAWLLRILYNHNMKRVRNILKLRLVEDIDEMVLSNVPFEPEVSEKITDEEVLAAIWRPEVSEKITDEEVLAAIWRLTENFRTVLVFADVEELSYKEIAEILDLPIGTVMSRLFRARKILRSDLAEYARKHGFVEVKRIAHS